MKNKIYSLKDLSKIISKKKNNGKKITHCHGVFDLLHIGHINHFKTSKNNGNILVVTITADNYVKKGPNRPYFNENIRAEALASLEIIDYVCINNSSTSINAINELKPNFYCKGQDYSKSKDDLTGNILKEKRAVELNGGKFVVTNDLMFSSSNLLNKFSSIISDQQRNYLNKIKSKYNFLKLKNEIERLSKLKVLIIGETIIDKYIFCEALGKSGKESVLSFKEFETEKYLGGVLAIARHVNSFTKNVSVISFVGEGLEEVEFIRNKLEKNIKLNLIKKKNSKTIIKSRLLDKIDNRKLIGIYNVDDSSISKQEEKLFLNKINKQIKTHDLIIISDYGHGMFTENVVSHISKLKKYKSLNAQINSTNMGFHNIRKYKNIQNIIINAGELRHEMRDREGDLEKLGRKLKNDTKTNILTITMGRAGAKIINQKNIIDCPAFGVETIDKVGAGDSMLSLLSICLYLKIDLRVSLLFASLAAAQSVKSIGNSKIINKEELIKTLFHLMK